SSPYSNTYMFLPISPTPPSGMMRSGWSLVGGIRFLGMVLWLEEGQLGGRLVGRRRHGHGGLIEAFKVFKGVEVGRDRGRGVGAGWVGRRFEDRFADGDRGGHHRRRLRRERRRGHGVDRGR